MAVRILTYKGLFDANTVVRKAKINPIIHEIILLYVCSKYGLRTLNHTSLRFP